MKRQARLMMAAVAMFSLVGASTTAFAEPPAGSRGAMMRAMKRQHGKFKTDAERAAKADEEGQAQGKGKGRGKGKGPK